MSPDVVIDGLAYQAFNEGEFNGLTTWMVRRYKTAEVDTASNDLYVECLLPLSTKDALVAIHCAIATDTWS